MVPGELLFEMHGAEFSIAFKTMHSSLVHPAALLSTLCHQKFHNWRESWALFNKDYQSPDYAGCRSVTMASAAQRLKTASGTNLPQLSPVAYLFPLLPSAKSEGFSFTFSALIAWSSSSSFGRRTAYNGAGALYF